PMNFMIAMPRLAANAATTAVVECSSADIVRHSRSAASASAYEGVEESLLHRIFGCSRFRMPLHRHDPAVGQFVSLEHAIVRPRGCNRLRCQFVHRLMMM